MLHIVRDMVFGVQIRLPPGLPATCKLDDWTPLLTEFENKNLPIYMAQRLGVFQGNLGSAAGIPLEICICVYIYVNKYISTNQMQ